MTKRKIARVGCVPAGKPSQIGCVLGALVLGTVGCGAAPVDEEVSCAVAPNFNNITLDFNVFEDTLTALVNGAFVASAADSSYKVGRTGIYKRALLNTSFDDYKVQINP
jgi:hypothetical protein